MIKTPIPQNTVELMSRVFEHNNMTLITFDFTNDITAMNEAGIRFNMRNVIDSQPFFFTKGPRNFTNIRTDGLKTVCENATNCVEYNAAKNAMNDKKKMDFDAIYYTFKDAQNPFDASLNAQFWEYSSSDIALTAIALVSRLGKFEPWQIKNFSKGKTKAFVELQEKEGLEAPSLIRQLSFVNKKIFQSDMKDKKDAYKVYRISELILENYESYEKFVKKHKRCDKDEIIKQQKKAVEIISA
jgi:hypothetical protein